MCVCVCVRARARVCVPWQGTDLCVCVCVYLCVGVCVLHYSLLSCRMDGFAASPSSAKRTGRTVTWQHTHPTIVHVSDLYEHNGRPRGGPRGQLVRAHGDRILATGQRDLAYHAHVPDGLDAPPQSRLTRRDCVFPGGATFSHLLIVDCQ
jgi:hypothetical protein